MKVRIDNLEIDVEKYHNLDLYITSLETVKKLIHHKDYDYIFVIDGRKKTGVGKSTLALFTALYLDPEFDVEKQLTFADISMMKRTFRKLEPGSVVIVDEAGAALNALDFMKSEVKDFSKTIEIVRAKKLVLILVLPTVFYLTKSVRLGINALIGIRRKASADFYLHNELIRAWAPYIEGYSSQKQTNRKPKPVYSFSWPDLSGSEVYREYHKKKMEFIDEWLSSDYGDLPKRPLTMADLARYFDVSQSTIARWFERGFFPEDSYTIDKETGTPRFFPRKIKAYFG